MRTNQSARPREARDLKFGMSAIRGISDGGLDESVKDQERIEEVKSDEIAEGGSCGRRRYGGRRVEGGWMEDGEMEISWTLNVGSLCIVAATTGVEGRR